MSKGRNYNSWGGVFTFLLLTCVMFSLGMLTRAKLDAEAAEPITVEIPPPSEFTEEVFRRQVVQRIVNASDGGLRSFDIRGDKFGMIRMHLPVIKVIMGELTALGYICTMEELKPDGAKLTLRVSW